MLIRMSEMILTVEDAARSLPDVVGRVEATGEAAVLTRSGRPVARIVAVPANGQKEDLITFLRQWRDAHPEPDDQFGEAIESSRRAIRPPHDPWE